ncbi:restriction endonuclease subunit S [Billgrantia desiderata]|uniref:restriction endonuclease subunit S n=1 Tax=Billgrantia desiderata TaxID=52021 RepID=UPI003F4100AA
MSERVLPEGWVEVSVGEIAEVVSGGTPKAGDPENFKVAGKGIPWLTPADLSGYGKKRIAHGARDLSEKGYASCSAKLMPAGSVLFSSRAPIGYVAISENEICTNQGFKSFVFGVGVDSGFAYYYLRSVRGLAESLGTGTTFKEVSGAKVKSLPFVLPSSEEQKVIADKLDELLAQVKNLKARLDAIPAILKRFRQSVLTAAVSGQLYSFDNANGWRDVCVGDLAALVTSGSRGWSKYYSDSGELFVRAQNIKNDVLDLDEVAYVDLPDRAEGTRTKIKEGDFLITITGANVTKCALVGMDVGVAYVSQHVGLVRWSERQYGPYLELFLKSESHGRKQLLDMAYGGGKPGLNLQNIRDVSLRLPSIEEQTEIVRRVDQLFAFADQVEQQVQNAQARVDKLTQSILAKAFRGELTAEWRAANPDLISGEKSAEALLERIKAEKANHKSVRARRSSGMERATT